MPGFSFPDPVVIVYDNLKGKGEPMDWEIKFYGTGPTLENHTQSH
jgi:hypothetical protein